MFQRDFEQGRSVFQLLRLPFDPERAPDTCKKKTISGCGWSEAGACETIETQDIDIEMALKQCCRRQSG